MQYWPSCGTPPRKELALGKELAKINRNCSRSRTTLPQIMRQASIRMQYYHADCVPSEMGGSHITDAACMAHLGGPLTQLLAALAPAHRGFHDSESGLAGWSTRSHRSVCIYIYIYIYTYLLTYLPTHTPTYLPTYIHTYLYVYIYIYIYKYPSIHPIIYPSTYPFDYIIISALYEEQY